MVNSLAKNPQPRPGSSPDRSAKAIFRALKRSSEPERRSEAVFDEAFTLFRCSMDDLVVARTTLAWRITRLIAVERGFIGTYQSVASLAEDHVDLWNRHRASNWDNCRFPEFDKHKLPLSPPPPVEEGEHWDHRLVAWCEAVERAAEMLRIDETDPFLCRSLSLMTSWETAHDAWPSRDQIITMESELADSAMERLLEGGHRKCASELSDIFKLTIPEAESLIRVAEEGAVKHVGASPDAQRAVLALKLESLAQRAREAYDLRAELAVYKEIANLLGLHAAGSSASMDDFIEAITEQRRNPQSNFEDQTLPSTSYRVRKLESSKEPGHVREA